MRKAFVALLVAAVLVTTLAVSVQAQTFYQRFGNLWAITLRSTGALTVGGNSNLTGDTTVGGTLDVSGATNLGSDLTAGGSVWVYSNLTVNPGATRVLVADGTLTPVSSNQPISAAAAIGTASIAAGGIGDLLLLTNVGSNTVTFTDTGTLKLGGNAALGAGDTLLLLSDGTNWTQVSKADN